MSKAKLLSGILKISVALIIVLFIVILFIKAQDLQGLEEKEEVRKFVNVSEKIVEKPPFKVPQELVYSEKGYEFYIDRERLNFKVKTPSNKMWYSFAVEDDKELNTKWKTYLLSAISIECIDDNFVSYQLNLEQNGLVKNVQINDNIITAEIEFPYFQIHFIVKFTVNVNEVRVEIPFDSIFEGDKYKITSIELFPFLGSSKGFVSGYFIIPENSGFIVDLSKSTKATQPYIGRVYGDDIGISQVVHLRNINPRERLNLPMYSVVYDNDFLITSIEQGAEYAYLKVYKSGLTTNYNWLTFKFVFREMYKKIINKKGEAVNWYQENKNEFSPTISYRFFSEDKKITFVDVAKEYKRYLLENNKLVKSDFSFSQIPIVFESLMADSVKKIFFKEYVRLTSFDDLIKINNELRSEGLENLVFILKGYSKDGISFSSPNHTPIDSRLFEKIKNIEEFLDVVGNERVFLYVDYLKVQPYSNVSKRYLAQNISEQLMVIDENYLLNPIYISNFSKENLPGDVLAIDSIGKYVFTTYSNSRGENLQVIQKALEGFLGSKKIALYSPNLYAFKYANYILGLDLKTSDFLIEEKKIPFLQVILSGVIPYFSSPINNSSDVEHAVLQLIATNTYPLFVITKEPIAYLSMKKEVDIFSSSYDNWKDTIIKVYDNVNNALKEVIGCEIVDFENPEEFPELYITTYSNGKVIYTNFSNNEIKYGNVVIPAKSFVVR
ncbi:MAG: hypothetical protein H0Z24_08585 [Thermosipho sp. (in: Bacteria)]|nr:hypothetical protein [Thermosipho sp. (in: thermotogales)]